MSLNKFKNSPDTPDGTEKGRKINLNIGCSTFHVSNSAKIDTLDGSTYDLVTPDIGSAGKVLASNGSGGTFWQDPAGGPVTGIQFNDQLPATLNRILKTSATDGSTANQSVLIEDGTDVYIGDVDIDNKVVTNSTIGDSTDITNLNIKTENIQLSTTPGQTDITGTINIGIFPNNYTLPNTSLTANQNDVIAFNNITKELEFQPQIGVIYNGTQPSELNRHVKLSSTDGKTVNESLLIEDGTDVYLGDINVNNKVITNNNLGDNTDIQELQQKTENISLGTTSGKTFIEGEIQVGNAGLQYILPADTSGATNGDMLTYNSVTKNLDWENQNQGTVTQVLGGIGLEGDVTSSGSIHLSDTTVVADSYTNADITVNAQGQITSASNGTVPDLTDLETKTQNIDLTSSPNNTIVNGDLDVTTTLTENGVPVLTKTIISTSTGIITGGHTELNTPTTVTITGGSGVINYNDIITDVSWNGITSPVLTVPINFVYVDTLGVISINQIPPTAEKMRSDIFLSAISVEGGIITDILHPPMPLENQAQTIYDFARSLGIFNMSANVFTFNGANLNIDKSGTGRIFSIGANFQNAGGRYDPSVVEQPLLTVAQFRYSAQAPAGLSASTTLIDSANYDLNGVITTISGPTNTWQIQYIYMNVNNDIQIEYGQNISYTTIEQALDAIGIEDHIKTVQSNGYLLRGYLVLKKDTGDLSNTTDNRFVEAGRFGSSSVSGGTSSFTDLQTAYNNSLTKPQITTTALGSVQIKEGTGDNQLPLLEILNNADTINTTLRADGAISCKNELLLTHTATELGDHSLEIIHDTGLFPDSKAIDIDYITSVAPLQNEDVILINIDKSNTTGGEVEGIIVVATEGSAQCTALEVGVGCNPLLHEKGSFTDPTTGIDINGILTPLGSLSGSTLFVADNDFIIIADANPFEEIEFLLSVVASQNVNPTFEFSTGVTPTWNSFSPVDGTNGLQNNGVIIWSSVDTPLWDNASGFYKIRMTRTRNNLNTQPIAQNNGIRIASVEEFYWDKDASVKMFDLQVNDTVTIGISPDNYVLPNTSLGALNGDVLVYNSATKDMEFAAQSGGGGGVSNLSLGSTTITTQDIDNDNGTGLTLPSATNSLAGLMSRDKFNEVVVNNAKVSNVTTDLSVGTHNSTNIDINSSDGLNVTIPSASNTLSGIMTSTNFNNITTNNAKVSNVTHTSEVTGSTALTVNKIVITNKTNVPAEGADLILIVDDTDGNFKNVTAQSIADLGGGGVSALSNGGTTSLVSNSNGILKGLVAGSNITFSPITSTDVTINSSITGSGAIRSAYTTSFYHGGALNNVNINYLGYGTGVVNTPTTAYNQLLPAQVGYESVLNHVGMTIGGFYTAVAPTDKTVTVRVWVYNTTTSPILTGTITPTAALPNAANWVLIQTTVLNFGQDQVGHYYRSQKQNYTGNSTIGSLVGGSVTDDYICTLSIQQNNAGVNSLPDLVVNLDWDVPI